VRFGAFLNNPFFKNSKKSAIFQKTGIKKRANFSKKVNKIFFFKLVKIA